MAMTARLGLERQLRPLPGVALITCFLILVAAPSAHLGRGANDPPVLCLVVENFAYWTFVLGLSVTFARFSPICLFGMDQFLR